MDNLRFLILGLPSMLILIFFVANFNGITAIYGKKNLEAHSHFIQGNFLFALGLLGAPLIRLIEIPFSLWLCAGGIISMITGVW